MLAQNGVAQDALCALALTQINSSQESVQLPPAIEISKVAKVKADAPILLAHLLLQRLQFVELSHRQQICKSEDL
jgi:hypothetical protein